MSTVVLGVSGSVASYRACDLARDLMRLGHTVRVCLTDSAQNFVSAALFEALTGQPCLQSAFDEPLRGRMAHIDWARATDVLVVAPATANVLNKLAAGVGDDMLTTIALAYDGPIVLAPAMNPTMYADETTQASLKVLAARGAWIVDPADGDVACGENGQGKLASVAQMTAAVESVLSISRSLEGKTVLITSGPTHEPIDDVRFIGNRSSGKMGAALAKAALLMGAKVVVVSGPTSVTLPLKAIVVRVTTALEMQDEAKKWADKADLVIGAAAVADFRVANPTKGKLRRQDGTPKIELAPNPDVIAELALMAKPGAKVVAFAAEPGPDLAESRAKMKRKNVHAVVVNDVSDASIGFESDENQVVLVTSESEERSPKTSKIQVALWILEQLSV